MAAMAWAFEGRLVVWYGGTEPGRGVWRRETYPLDAVVVRVSVEPAEDSHGDG
jgi:hypothetical protein